MKKVARQLLTRVRGALVLNWRQKQQARAQVKIAIEDALDEGLPRAYTPDLYKTKCAMCHAADGSGSVPMGQKTGAHDFRSAEIQKMTDAQLLKPIEPEDIANMAVFLASDESRMVTGQIYPVDGGITIS